MRKETPAEREYAFFYHIYTTLIDIKPFTNMPLRALIIDDEAKSREVLSRQLEHFCPEIEVIGNATNGNQAAQLIREMKPDVVFLDVELGADTGFDLLKSLGEVKFDVVFTTAHEKYALEAIRFSALDYLMKPILAEELKRSVARLLKKKSPEDRKNHLDALIYNINYSNSDKKLGLPMQHGLEFISISEVVYCESENNYTIFHMKNGQKHLVSRTMLEFDHLLKNYYFFRAHQSYLVNLRHVQRFNKNESSSLIMSSGQQIDVSRRKKTAILQALSEFSLIPGM
jgi:two-component system LytT family response regulator